MIWPDAARALQVRLGDGSLHPQVQALLRQPGMRRVLVACSGGADSMCMLCLLWAWAKPLGVELVVGHYNHRWRGAASDADATFVREVAEALSCEYVLGARPENEAAFTETTARALRLEFLRSAAARHRCQLIAFGHQQDDILETQLQRLARGSGTDGLAAPRPVHYFEGYPDHVRPLLHLRGGDVRMALNVLDIPWQEDPSNEDVEIARNALRHKVIPELLDALSHNIVAGSVRSRMLLDEDATALDVFARATLPEAYEGASVLSRPHMQAAPRALTRRAVVAWLGKHGLIASASAAAIDQLLDAIGSGKLRHRVSLGRVWVAFDSDIVCIERSREAEADPRIESTFMRMGESVLLPRGGVLESALVELDADLRADILAGGVDVMKEAYLLPKAGALLEVRGWEPGDRFRPLGAPGSKKLKDWFISRRIPVKERKRLPVVLSSSHEIVWVPGFPPADSSKINAATKLALRLTYQNRNPLSP